MSKKVIFVTFTNRKRCKFLRKNFYLFIYFITLDGNNFSREQLKETRKRLQRRKSNLRKKAVKKCSKDKRRMNFVLYFRNGGEKKNAFRVINSSLLWYKMIIRFYRLFTKKILNGFVFSRDSSIGYSFFTLITLAQNYFCFIQIWFR